MKSTHRNSLDQAFLFSAEGVMFALLSVFAALFIYCLFYRLPYPFELEWLEGEILSHALRLLHGQPVYAPPETAFIPQVYPPLYYIFMVPLLKIFSLQFWIPRCISLCSLTGILVFLYYIPIKEGGSRRVGILTAGLFICLYEVNGTWYDIGRNDMLFYFFIIGGCFSLAYISNKKWAIFWAVMCCTLGFYTKQSTPLFLACATLYVFIQDKKHGLIFFLLLASIILSSFLLINYATDGWYLTYTIINPLRHTAKRPHFLSEIRQDLFHELPIFFVLIAAFGLRKMFTVNGKKAFTIWEYTLFPAALCYLIVGPMAGSERNELIPLTLWGCMLLGLFLSELSLPRNRGEWNSNILVVYILIIFQLLLLLYNPLKHIPAPGSTVKGRAIISMIKNMPREVYIPYHSEYAVMAGKQMIFNGGAFWCYEVTSKKKYYPRDLINKIEKKYFSAIILDGTGYYVLLKERRPLDNSHQLFFLGDVLSEAIWKNYEITDTLAYDSPDQFRPMTGYLTRPERILRPKGTAIP